VSATPVPTVAIEEEQREIARRSPSLALCRCVDVLLAAAGLLVCAPLLVVMCVAIRLDSPGPAIFRQRRLGRHKRPFTVHKFRTMRLQADPSVHREYVAQLIGGDARPHAGGNGRDLYKLAADDRVTRVGRFLRSSSLDELPQLYDVLRGHMSLVGPRPVIAYEVELYPPSYGRRFAVKPGLTGLWQVSGRSERTYHEMVALDIRWVETHSFGQYLSILARTPWVLLRHRNAA
jgi:lipopolysaccharide/colanic/teichoic acid biosynthesis glycosyltransferase